MRATLLCPVVSVSAPAVALAWFAALPGAVDAGPGDTVGFGPDRLRVIAAGAALPALRARPFDHLALAVTDVDRVLTHVLRAGAALHPAYTPDGPREIAAFGPTGMRYAFVIGPDGVPVEFCAPCGASDRIARVTGLAHLGLRTDRLAAEAADLVARGAVEQARHSLPGAQHRVQVHFLQEVNLLWELFDEPAPQDAATPPGTGWIGVAPQGAACNICMNPVC